MKNAANEEYNMVGGLHTAYNNDKPKCLPQA
jgi:hypothetical protein